MRQMRKAILSAGDEHALYERLASDDPTAPSDLAMTYLDSLTESLAAHNSALLDPHICAMAVGDALVALIKNPRTYDPARGGLGAYLQMSAQGRLKNLLHAEKRHSSRRTSWDAVEVSPRMVKYVRDDDSDPALLLLRREKEREAVQRLPAVPASVQAGLTPWEEKVLELMRARERKTILYAAVLNLTHLSPAAQRHEVKKVKDRLSKRLERAKDQHE